jgi:ribosome-associated translation inhibitor RaiA
MQVPAEIAFRNCDKPDWAEAEIRDHISRLERIYDRLVTCRVRVDQRADNSKHTIPPAVHIEIGVPGHEDLVVSHEPDHLQRKFQRPDLHNAINEAFRIAQRRLSEYKDQLQDKRAPVRHESAKEFLGRVAELRPAEEIGFLMTASGSLLYFHRNSLLSGDFDKLEVGTDVHYVEEMADNGPIASKVRVKTAG